MKNKTETYIAKTFNGLEGVLMEELQQLGAKNCILLNRSVQFEGDMEMMYRANYFCRTAIRVLWLVKKFTFENNNQFYKEVFAVSSEKFLKSTGTLSISTNTYKTIFKTPLFASMLAKDAICDRFRELYNERPSVEKYNPDVQFHLHIFNNECHLFLDSSGESLHKRGYKIANHPAPINEVVAAGMIKLSGWNQDCDFIDCMCGSGTIPIEAAMIALNIPSGFYRKHFGFMGWKTYDHALWKQIQDEANIQEDVAINFYGSDVSPRMVEIARTNIREARLEDFIHIETKEITESRPERTPAFVMINPPYGERLEVEDIDQLYKKMGDTFKTNYSNCQAFVISSDVQAMKNIGLKTSKRFTLFNGPLECKFWGYDLYRGSKKNEQLR
ncbi:MAG TPA: class I SAM-dependent RNA methyltransferase [Bacteroidales bacterium]|nr:class I SAM-dependent RNA methyltransferase [Bacteroidales bacterium]